MYGIKQIILLVLALSLFSTLISTVDVTAAPKTKYLLTMYVSGNGDTSPPAGGTYKYNEGTEKTITATPDPGWEFDSWSGDVNDPNSASTYVVMNADKAITANFTPIVHDLTMAISGNGTISPSEGTHTYNEGTVVDIIANPDTGWQFDSWSGDVASPTSASTTVTIDSNKKVTANFSEITEVTYDLTMTISGNGTISPSEGTHTYNEGTIVDVTATPDTGWQFDSWTGDVADPNSASTTVTVDSNKTITANFSQIDELTYELAIAVNGNGATSPTPGTLMYNEGTVVNITATPDSGWLFVNWTGDVADPNSASTIVNMDGDKTVTANFTEIAEVTYDLTMAINGNGTTSPATGTRTYNEGTVVNITATPDSGWLFVNWTGDVADANSASTTVNTDRDKTITANFTEIAEVTHILTIATNGNGITSPSIGSHRYNESTLIAITATPDSGWEFDSWTGDVADPNSASTTTNMNEDKSLTAIFTQVTNDGEVGGCGCNSSASRLSATELLVGWGIIGLCWGGGYYVVGRSKKRKI